MRRTSSRTRRCRSGSASCSKPAPSRSSHVIVPIRSLDLAAASRVRGSNYGRNIFARGGLWGTVNPVKQRDALATMLYELMFTIAKFELPHTLLEFPALHHRLGVHAPCALVPRARPHARGFPRRARGGRADRSDPRGAAAPRTSAARARRALQLRLKLDKGGRRPSRTRSRSPGRLIQLCLSGGGRGSRRPRRARGGPPAPVASASGTSISMRTSAPPRVLPRLSARSVLGPPPPSAPCMTKFSARTFAAS